MFLVSGGRRHTLTAEDSLAIRLDSSMAWIGRKSSMNASMLVYIIAYVSVRRSTAARRSTLHWSISASVLSAEADKH